MSKRILQRYVLRELISPTVLGLIVFTFVLLSTHLFRLIDLLVNRGVPLPLFGMLVGTLLPPLLVLTIPMALLVGVLMGVGRLAADNEIMAMRTSGVHLFHVFIPVVLASTVLTAGLYFANRDLVPRLANVNETLLDQIKFIVATHLEPQRVFSAEGQREVHLYFDKRSLLTGHMENMALKVEVGNAGKQTEQSYLYASARQGRVEPNPFAGYMDIVLTSGTLHHLDNTTTASDFRNVVAKFGELVWRMELTAEKDTRPGKRVRGMTNGQIARTIRDGQIDPSDVGVLKAELQQRRSIPLACMAFMLLGVPLAIRVRPTGKAVAFSIAFGLIFFYYIMLKWGGSLCKESGGDSLFGIILIFLPNVIVGGGGILLFFKILRQ